MWLVLDRGFVSVVQYKYDPSQVLVRSRVREDISNVLGDDVEIVADSAADYLYRAVVGRERLASALLAAVEAVDYTSHFKEVAMNRSAPNPSRTNAYYDTWTAMSRMQPTRPYGGGWQASPVGDCPNPGPTARRDDWGSA